MALARRVALLSLLAGGEGANSSACLTLGSTDAILLIDPQNCFMETRALSPSPPAYPLAPSDLTDGGATIPAGPLSVSGSSEIIDVMNDWIQYAMSNTSNTTVLATLDWHPPTHCSFCNLHSGGIQAGLWCVRGADTVDTFNASHRCTDAISIAAYQAKPLRACLPTSQSFTQPSPVLSILKLSRVHTRSRILTFSRTFTHIRFLSHSLTHMRTHKHTHSITHSHTPFSHALTFTVTLPYMLPLTFTR